MDATTGTQRYRFAIGADIYLDAKDQDDALRLLRARVNAVDGIEIDSTIGLVVYPRFDEPIDCEGRSNASA